MIEDGDEVFLLREEKHKKVMSELRKLKDHIRIIIAEAVILVID